MGRKKLTIEPRYCVQCGEMIPINGRQPFRYKLLQTCGPECKRSRATFRTPEQRAEAKRVCARRWNRERKDNETKTTTAITNFLCRPFAAVAPVDRPEWIRPVVLATSWRQRLAKRKRQRLFDQLRAA